MIEAKDYLKTYPNATLDEYVKFVDDWVKNENNARVEQYKNKTKWYDDLIGRYFCINFNGNSKAYCKLTTEKDGTFIGDPCYSINKNGSEIFFKKEKRFINQGWFDNPYEYSYNKDTRTKITELTQEQYCEITEKINKIIEYIFDIHGMY